MERLIQADVPVKKACLRVGIPRRTYYYWRKRRGAAASTDSPEVPPENTVVKSAGEGDAQSTQREAS